MKSEQTFGISAFEGNFWNHMAHCLPSGFYGVLDFYSDALGVSTGGSDMV